MMRLGNAAWGLRETPLARQLEITAQMGLTLLELSIAGHENDFLQGDADAARIAEARALFSANGLEPECACTGNDFIGDEAEVEAQVKRVLRAVDIAADVGAKYLRVFAGFASDSVVFGERLDRMLRALEKTARHGEKRGVVPVVETHGGVAKNGDALVHFSSVTTRVDYWPAILATGVKINYDPANFAAVGAIHPEEFYRDFAESIPYIHLKDFRSVPGGVLPAACGEGRLDWDKLMATLAEGGYNGPALIEYELPEDVEDGLKRSVRFLERWRS